MLLAMGAGPVTPDLPPLQCLGPPRVWAEVMPQEGPLQEELILPFFQIIPNVLEACHQEYRNVTVTSVPRSR